MKKTNSEKDEIKEMLLKELYNYPTNPLYKEEFLEILIKRKSNLSSNKRELSDKIGIYSDELESEHLISVHNGYRNAYTSTPKGREIVENGGYIKYKMELQLKHDGEIASAKNAMQAKKWSVISVTISIISIAISIWAVYSK
jgi:hypothetical protein